MAQKFLVGEQLAAVRLFVHQKVGQLDSDLGGTTFATTFPRRVFTEDDMMAPLQQLGMVYVKL